MTTLAQKLRAEYGLSLADVKRIVEANKKMALDENLKPQPRVQASRVVLSLVEQAKKELQPTTRTIPTPPEATAPEQPADASSPTTDPIESLGALRVIG